MKYINEDPNKVPENLSKEEIMKRFLERQKGETEESTKDKQNNP